MVAGGRICRSVVVVAVAALLASCSGAAGSSGQVTVPVHVPVSLVADWLPVGFEQQAGSIDTLPVNLTDAGGQQVGSFTPAAGLIFAGSGPSSSAAPLVLIAATWLDDLPADYWQFVAASPVARRVSRDRRELVVVPADAGPTVLYFRESGLLVTTTTVGLALPDAEHLVASLRIVQQ